MRAVVAYRGDTDGAGSLHVGAVLRRTTDAELAVVAVLPRVSFAGEDRADQEYARYLDGIAEEARTSATEVLGHATSFERVTATSVAAGLVEAVERADADALILGCASDAVRGNIVVGSVGERLLHSSPVPLMMAPHEYAPDEGTRFTTLTVAYADTPQARETLGAACDLAVRYDLALRVATFVPRANTMYPPEVGLDAEDMIAAQAAEQAVAVHAEALEQCRARGVTDVTAVVGRGRGWAGALGSVSWGAGDLLVVGSSRIGHVARVFLGSTATKILRHTPVPVLVVPTGTATWVA